MKRKLNILVVDDDAALRDTIAHFLDTCGHEVLQAQNGNEAMSMLESADADVVVMDILMPEKEGISTIVDIRKRASDIKIIAISGGGKFNRFDLLKAAEELGADYALAKPFEFEDLEKAIAACFASSESQHPLSAQSLL